VNYFTFISIGMILCSYGSLISYSYLLMPGGKVLRDAYDAKLTPFRRITRRVIPFVLLALPIYYSREFIEQTNRKYKDE